MTSQTYMLAEISVWKSIVVGLVIVLWLYVKINEDKRRRRLDKIQAIAVAKHRRKLDKRSKK